MVSVRYLSVSWGRQPSQGCKLTELWGTWALGTSSRLLSRCLLQDLRDEVYTHTLKDEKTQYRPVFGLLPEFRAYSPISWGTPVGRGVRRAGKKSANTTEAHKEAGGFPPTYGNTCVKCRRSTLEDDVNNDC